MKPKISIVVPTFNQGRYIRQCLDSIAKQSERDFEVLIQDSCSNDETEAICLEFTKTDVRFKYFQEKDSGQSDGLNRGLRRSQGIFWTWLCSDDFYTNFHALEKLTAVLPLQPDEDSTWAGSFGEAELVSEMALYLEEYITMKRHVRHRDFKNHWPFSQPASMLYRAQVTAVGGINADLHFGMDLDLFIRMTAAGSGFKYIPEKIASVRVQPDSKSIKFRVNTAKCALGIVRFYYGNVGFPPYSSFCVELGWGRVEILRGVLKQWKKKLQREPSQEIGPDNQTNKRNLSTILWHILKMPVPFVYSLLARYVFSLTLGRFFSYQLLTTKKQVQT